MMVWPNCGIAVFSAGRCRPRTLGTAESGMPGRASNAAEQSDTGDEAQYP